MRIATWNVNSLKARLPRVEEWLSIGEPDVLCMQETKLADSAFPAMTFHALGYEASTSARAAGTASPSSAGSASTTSSPASTTATPADAEARLVSATCGGVRVTSRVRAERSLDRPRALHLQARVARAAARAPRRHRRPRRRRHRVRRLQHRARRPRRVRRREVRRRHPHEPGRARRARRARGWGLVDVFREVYEDDRLFSWWDYRAGDFHEGRGMRIDLVLASQPLADGCDGRSSTATPARASSRPTTLP